MNQTVRCKPQTLLYCFPAAALQQGEHLTSQQQHRRKRRRQRRLVEPGWQSVAGEGHEETQHVLERAQLETVHRIIFVRKFRHRKTKIRWRKSRTGDRVGGQGEPREQPRRRGVAESGESGGAVFSAVARQRTPDGRHQQKHSGLISAYSRLKLRKSTTSKSKVHRKDEYRTYVPRYWKVF